MFILGVDSVTLDVTSFVVLFSYVAVTFKPAEENVSPVKYVSFVGFVVTVIPVTTGSVTVMSNDVLLPP